MFDPMDYPENYDFLTDRQKEDIINYMTSLKGKYWTDIIQLMQSSVPELAKRGNAYVEEYRKKVDVAQKAFRAAGIYVEFGWRHHSTEWFLATRNDAEMREEDLFTVMEGI